MLRLFKQYYPIRNVLFVISEGLLIFASIIVSSRLVLGDSYSFLEQGVIYKSFLVTAICQISIYYNDLYDLKIANSFTELYIRLLQSLGAAAITCAAVYFLFPDLIIKEKILLISVALAIIFIVSFRIGYTCILRFGMFNQRLMLLGNSDISEEIIQQIHRRKDSGYEISALISTDEFIQSEGIYKNINLIRNAGYQNIHELAEKLSIKKIVVALSEKRGALPIKELLGCRINGIEIIEGNTFYEMLTGKLIVGSINPGWLIFSDGFQKSLTQKLIKRTMDIVYSLFLLVILSPIIALLAILVKIDSKGPIIFSQERIGEGRKPYMIHKFRSMKHDAERDCGPVWANENDDRITRIGYFIRKSRLDEIPQLWNILKGEMSFVGPRPERAFFIEQLEEIIPYFDIRFSVKPGLTGWAQVSYGYGASVKDAVQKLDYDLFYIKNMSMLMDIMIIVRTLKIVLFGQGR